MTSTSNSTSVPSDRELLLLTRAALRDPSAVNLAALNRSLDPLHGAALAAALADLCVLLQAHGGVDAVRALLVEHGSRLVIAAPRAPSFAGVGRTTTGRPHHGRLLTPSLDWSEGL